MSNLNYLLVESNRIRLGGYDTVSREFIENAIGCLYTTSASNGAKLVKYYSSKYINGVIKISDLTHDFSFDKKYLLTCEESQVLRSMCFSALHDSSYKELLFILLVTGLVNSKSLLANFRDIGYVTNRVMVRKKQINSEIISSLWVSVGFYCKLMGIYIENTSNGISYGFNVYDFVFHIIKTMGKNWNRILFILGRIPISDWSCFSVNSKQLLNKYKEEIAVMLPYTYGNISLSEDIIVRLLALVDPILQNRIVTNEVFLEKTYKKCVLEN